MDTLRASQSQLYIEHKTLYYPRLRLLPGVTARIKTLQRPLIEGQDVPGAHTIASIDQNPDDVRSTTFVLASILTQHIIGGYVLL